MHVTLTTLSPIENTFPTYEPKDTTLESYSTTIVITQQLTNRQTKPKRYENNVDTCNTRHMSTVRDVQVIYTLVHIKTSNCLLV